MEQSHLWWRDGVIYQIYPRSFADSNGDGIGDLIGITQRLDYLVELGVDAIWLSPINPSPDVDFGYDVADYRNIDPKHGTLADFDHLVKAAHERGLRIILDLVLNHTSDQHPWFLESRSSLDNPRRDWYIWRGSPKGKREAPNQWQSVFGGKAWEFDEVTGQYYYHMFCPEQPDLNWRNPEVYREMLDIFRFWAERGVDGFRLDVFNQYFVDAQFRDNPRKCGIRPFDCQHHLYDTNQPEIQQVVADIRAVLDRYPERYAVGETFLPTTEMASSYSGPGKLHATFDFTMLKSPWNPARYLQCVLRQEELLPEGGWPNYVLNNHDNSRTASRLRAGRSDEKLKVAAAMLLTLRGTPFLYQGEEIGMRDIQVSRAELQDPVGKRYWPLPVGRDGCRSPMQWNGEANAGFTTGKPWLKLHPGYKTRNVEAQRKDPASLFNFYKSLLRLRRKYAALQRGMFLPLHHNPQRVLAYLRQDATQTILVALNFARRRSKLALGGEITRHQWEMLLSNKEKSQPSIDKGWLQLDGHEVCILLQKPGSG
ncbi:MAG TPA: alpha-glucosidase [Anaerolineaceae bacterium]|nr:alpha-glucosidase [Anaerolineaceae bacterium]